MKALRSLNSCSLVLVTGVAVLACTDNGNPSEKSDTQGGASGTATSGGTAGTAGTSSGSGGTVATGGTSGTVTGGASGSSGTSPGGAAGTSGTSGAAGATSGGTAGNAGAGGTAGAAGTGGTAGGGTGGNGGTGGSGGGSGGLYTCPSGVTGMPLPQTPMVTRVAGVPSMFGTSSSNVEGPVWIDGSLYVSHIQEGVTNPPPSRILKITGTTAEEFLLTAGTNGLAVNAMGAIVGARHTTGDIAALNLGTKMFTPVAAQYMSARFDSPNDLAIRRDGNIYFSDPDFQAPSTRPQTQTRVYRINPTGAVSVVDNTLQNPNGVSLSLDENTLYVATSGNLYRYTVMADGTTSTSTMINGAPGSDGMVLDCAGNIYLTNGNQHRVDVVTSTGTSVGTISMGIPGGGNGAYPTNVAFGGANHQRLYITTRGSGADGAGLYYIDLNIPGMPY